MLSRRDVLKGVAASALLGSGATSASGARAQVARPEPLRVGDRPVEVAVEAVSTSTVRIVVSPLDAERATPVPEDGALAAPSWTPVTRMRSHDASRTLDAGALRVEIAPDLTIRILNRQRQLIQRLRFEGSIAAAAAGSPSLCFLLPDGPLLGLGEGGPQFDRKGSVDEMRNGQGGYRLRTHGGRVPIQWLVGTDGWGVYIHQPLGRFDFTGAEGSFFSPDLLPLDVFVVASADPATILREYARMTGLPEMPALWTFGYMQSHRTLSGPEEIVRVARTFREKKLPCDTLIYLGTEFTPSGWNTRNGEFAWHSGNFPKPKEIIDALHELDYRVVLHAVIEGRRLRGSVRDACSAPEPSGRDAQDRWPDDRSVGCYWPHHKPVFDLGIDGWWPDQGDGLDAPSRLNRIRMYWEGSQLWRPNERPFALHRNGYAGMQRYAAFLWSGDVYTTWETLRTHVSVAINTGLSGIPYWGTDIGGFVPTAEYTGELHVRWFQFGAFCPLFRAHGRTWHLRLPWGWNTGELGPNELRSDAGGAANPDPRELRNPEVEPICRKYLELRYRMLPYIYTTARDGCETGLPMIRALWLHHPGDAEAVRRGDEYLWGRDILVAPVVEKGATSRRVYLPRGVWYDFWTEERIEGGREIERHVDLETVPLYVRAGAVVPFAPIRQYTDERVDGPLTLVVYPGADATSTMYEDDGRTFDYKQGAFTRLEMAWRDDDRRLTVSLARGSRMLTAERRRIEMRVAGTRTSRTITFEGRPLDVRLR
jgi:alpha-glucosidase (family GH31 glycosyl hydrolase)